MSAPAVTEMGVFKARDEVMSAAEAVFIAEEGKSIPSEFEVVLVKPGESLNRRFYSAEALKQASDAGFWDNSKMFLDHTDTPTMPFKRSIKDLVSGIESTRIGKGGEVIGKGRFFRPDFAAFAAEAKDHMGVSIVHQFKGQRYRGNDGHNHERVDQFLTNVSVDWVAYPSAGGGETKFLPARESLSEDDVDWEQLTAEDVKSHAPTVYDAIVTEAQADMSGAENAVGAAGEGAGNGSSDAPVSLTRADISTIVQEAIDEDRKAQRAEQDKKDAARLSVAEVLSKSGLPEPSRDRIARMFDGVTEVAVESVQTEIDSTKAEFAAAGAKGPQVHGLGGSIPATEPTAPMHTPSLNAMEAAFGVKFEDVIAEGKGN